MEPLAKFPNLSAALSTDPAVFSLLCLALPSAFTVWKLFTLALELGFGLVDQTQITPEVQDECFIAFW